MKKSIACTAVLASLALLTGCGGPNQDPNSKSLTELTFQPNFSYNGTDGYIFYGIEKGYFKDEGIELKLIPGRTAQAAVDSVVSGNVQIARTAGTNIILSASQGQKVISVGSVVQKSTFGFVVPDADAIGGFESLKGKEVLTVAGGPNNSIAPIVLKKKGVDPASISLVNVNPAALLTTYTGGQGDAALTSVPFATPVVDGKRPSTGLLFADAGVNIPDYSYVVTPKYLEENRETVAAFVRAAYKSFQEAVDHPKEAIQALARAVPTVTADEAAENQMLGWRDFRCNKPGEAGPEDPEQWARAVEIFQAAGLLKDDVDPTSLYTNDLFKDGSVKAGTC
jgi:NitT/TauT family transport system substrate-binding protein